MGKRAVIMVPFFQSPDERHRGETGRAKSTAIAGG
jgi:hypothetical protein